MHTSNNFLLHGGDTAFANRQKLLFAQLEIAERECNKTKDASTDSIHMEEDVEIPPKRIELPKKCGGQKRKLETQKFRGRESIFKRPQGPAPRTGLRSIPDYHRNPHKWVKYSLDDVPNEDMTDQSNARAAFSFLRELKARKMQGKLEMEVDEEEEMNSDEKDEIEQSRTIFKSRKAKSHVEYRKPEPSGTDKIESTSSMAVIVDNEEKPIFRSSKIVMPEYVVGQKMKKKTVKKDRPVVDRSKQLKLDHLQDIDDGEEN